MIDGFYIGTFKIYFYGIIIMVGAVAAVLISIKRAVEYGQDSDLVLDMVPWLLISGVIGARIWHVLTPSKSMGIGANYYFSHPIEILNIRQGGLGIPGGIIGGAIGLWLYTRRKDLKFLTWVDIISPGLAMAQAIGRWGNFINQELYGPPTYLPWGIYIDPSHRLPGFEEFTHFHPMFLYESIWNLINFLILSIFSKRMKDKLLPGDLFCAYLLIYGFGRFFLEFIRIDASYVGGINANQLTMLFVMVSSIVAIFLRRRKDTNNLNNSKIQ